MIPLTALLPIERLFLAQVFDEELTNEAAYYCSEVGARDLIDLAPPQQGQLYAEVDRCSRALVEVFHPHKLNVAALGNVVEQLHVHVIARFRDDPAWPAPVWGRAPSAYATDAREARIAQLQQLLGR